MCNHTDATAPDPTGKVEYLVRGNALFLRISTDAHSTETPLGALRDPQDAHSLAVYLTRAWDTRRSLMERAEKAEAERDEARANCTTLQSQFDEAASNFDSMYARYQSCEAQRDALVTTLQEVRAALLAGGSEALSPVALGEFIAFRLKKTGESRTGTPANPTIEQSSIVRTCNDDLQVEPDFNPLTDVPRCAKHPDRRCLVSTGCEYGLAGSCKREAQQQEAPHLGQGEN